MIKTKSKSQSQILDENRKNEAIQSIIDRIDRISSRTPSNNNRVPNNNDDVNGGRRKSKSRKGKRVKKTRRHRHRQN